jgi:uncharacterized hydrophobic protein (TIGR00271 family)
MYDSGRKNHKLCFLTEILTARKTPAPALLAAALIAMLFSTAGNTRTMALIKLVIFFALLCALKQNQNMSADLKNSLFNVLKYRFNLDEDKANEEEIIDSLRRNVEFRGTNLWALIFAIFIASIGLNVNSTAVIIGAMLISPLMGPIMGLGLGAGIFDFKLIKHSLKNLFIAMIIGLMTSALYFWITPLQEAQSELLARTSPTIWDVLIALFGGLAGIIASSRKNISNTIPGVAIATALMPPLCTAGYGIGTGNFYYFIGAFYLFLINSVFISIATFLMIRFLKFKPVYFVDAETETKVRRYIWSIAIFTILPSGYLAYRFVEQEIFKQNVQNMIRHELEANNLYIINQRIQPASREVTLLVYGERSSDSLLRAITSHKHFYGLEKAKINLHQTMNNKSDLSEMADLRNNLMITSEQHAAVIIEKEQKIKQLENRIRKSRSIDSSVYREFYALFEETEELSIQQSLVWKGQDKADTVLLVYVKNKRNNRNQKQMQNWLETRYGTKSVKVVMD